MSGPPYLTPRAIALHHDMKGKARSTIEGAAGPGVDASAMSSKLFAAEPHIAMKLLGCGVSPKIDVRDEAYLQSWAALEKAGAFAPQEMTLFAHQIPAMRGIVQRAYHLSDGDVSGMPPASVRAHAFAQFFNGRTEEGQEGTHLHIGVRRAFERMMDLFAGMAAIANRMGFYKASDLFEPAYRRSGAMYELTPNEPGEAFPIFPNVSKSH